MGEGERRKSMEREISSIRSSSSGAGEPSSSADDAGEETNAQEDARNNKNYAATAEKKHSENNFSSDNSTVGGGGGGGSGSGGIVIVAGVVVDAIIPACNETVSDEKKKKSSKKKRSRNSGAHTCEECGKTFTKGQSLGGHMRKHYDIQKIIDKRRAREKPKETPAPAVERRVQEPAALTCNTVAAMVEVEEVRTASSCNAPLESHNPAPLEAHSAAIRASERQW